MYHDENPTSTLFDVWWPYIIQGSRFGEYDQLWSSNVNISSADKRLFPPAAMVCWSYTAVVLLLISQCGIGCRSNYVRGSSERHPLSWFTGTVGTLLSRTYLTIYFMSRLIHDTTNLEMDSRVSFRSLSHSFVRSSHRYHQLKFSSNLGYFPQVLQTSDIIKSSWSLQRRGISPCSPMSTIAWVIYSTSPHLQTKQAASKIYATRISKQ